MHSVLHLSLIVTTNISSSSPTATPMSLAEQISLYTHKECEWLTWTDVFFLFGLPDIDDGRGRVLEVLFFGHAYGSCISGEALYKQSAWFAMNLLLVWLMLLMLVMHMRLIILWLVVDRRTNWHLRLRLILTWSCGLLNQLKLLLAKWLFLLHYIKSTFVFLDLSFQVLDFSLSWLYIVVDKWDDLHCLLHLSWSILLHQLLIVLISDTYGF